MLVKHIAHLFTPALNMVLNLLGGDMTFGGEETLAIVDLGDLRESDET